MFGRKRYSKQFWRKDAHSKRKSLYGGEAKSPEEVRELSAHINAVEEKELKEFENGEFEDMWDEVENEKNAKNQKLKSLKK
jgi:hypothetical protein